MSLVVRLSVNDGPMISYVTVRRMEGGTDPDSINTYEWHVHQALPRIDEWGKVEHRYGDGAVTLLAKVMTVYEEQTHGK